MTLLLSQTGSPPSGDAVLDFAQYGLLGLFVILLLTRQVITKGTYLEMKERAQRAEAEVARLHAVMEQQVIPALSRSTDVIARSIEKRSRG